MYKYHKSQKGQAMSEYMVLLPAAVMIAIAAGLVTGFITNSLTKSVDGLNRTGIEELCGEIQAPDEGPLVAQLGQHTIELTGNVYNEADDTTTVVYRVTSGGDPSISHWMLGLPEDVAANILEVSENNWERFVLDPTTNVAGVKFDDGYESSDAKDAPSEEEDEGKVKGPKKKVLMGELDAKLYQTIDGVSRDVTLLISGQYDFGSLETSVKAGGEVYVTTISAPRTIHDPSLDVTCEDQVQ